MGYATGQPKTARAGKSGESFWEIFHLEGSAENAGPRGIGLNHPDGNWGPRMEGENE